MADFKFKAPVNTDIHTELISKLFHFRNQLHIIHLESTSYSEHIALNGLYDSVLSITDELAETIQGKLGTRLKGYKSYPFVDNCDASKCINEHLTYLMSYRSKLVTPSWNNIDNQLQVLQDKLESTLYLLTLK